MPWDPVFWARDWGRSEAKNVKKAVFQLFRGSPVQTIGVLHVQLKYVPSQGGRALTADTRKLVSFFRIEGMDGLRVVGATTGE